MEIGQIEKVESLLCDEYTEDEIQAIVSQIDDQEVLYVSLKVPFKLLIEAVSQDKSCNVQGV